MQKELEQLESKLFNNCNCSRKEASEFVRYVENMLSDDDYSKDDCVDKINELAEIMIETVNQIK